MQKTITRLAVAGALAGALGFGGVSLASAQEGTDESTTTVADDATEGTTDVTEDRTGRDGAPESTDDDGCDHGDDAEEATGAAA